MLQYSHMYAVLNQPKPNFDFLWFLPVVENDCTNFYAEHAFFDLSYASLSQLKLNVAFFKTR